ncbi:MAG: galactose oxidase [Alphaproteobacteria bacterium]|nr:galactose oxidase [Alphaproteobacteria bacterium]MCB9697523.1 galactose oxidase [Alphaproteobacteria bacterium]
MLVLFAACRATSSTDLPTDTVPTDVPGVHSGEDDHTAAETGTEAHTGEPSLGTWVTGTDLPLPIQEIGVAALDGEVVTVGGFVSSGAFVATALAFDPVAGSWRRLADVPERMHHAVVATVDGTLFVLGSLGQGFAANGHSWAYDPVADAWTPRAPLPAGTERGGGVAVVVDGRIHVVGGIRGGQAVGEHHVYDPTTDAWTVAAPMPTPRDHLVGGWVGGRLVAAGGRFIDSDEPLDVVERWDPASDSWSSGAPMPTARGGLAGCVVDGALLTFGGEGDHDDEHGVFDQTEAYDAALDRWTALAPMPTPRHGTGAALVGGVVWIPGGGSHQSLEPTATVEGFLP